MPHTSRIPTPLKQHWHRFRLGILPILCFIVCLIVTLWLWQRQAYLGVIVGEVEAQSMDVLAGIDGEILNQEYFWERYDPINKNDVVCQLDDRFAQARLATITAESEKLLADLEAARTDLEIQQSQLQLDHEREKLRLLWNYEERRVEYLALNAELNSDVATLRGVQASLDLLKNLNARRAGLVSDLRLIELEQQKATLEAAIEQKTRERDERSQQVLEARNRMNEYPGLNLAAAETVLAPIRAEIRVQETLMEQVRLEIDSLVVRAPIDGVVNVIYRRPGQRILASEPVIQIARDDGRYVISYVREKLPVRPYVGMPVSLRLAQPGGQQYQSKVERVGPQVEPVPPHQLRDQTIPEWATPVTIGIPDQLDGNQLRPGQLLHVIFNPSTSD